MTQEKNKGYKHPTTPQKMQHEGLKCEFETADQNLSDICAKQRQKDIINKIKELIG